MLLRFTRYLDLLAGGVGADVYRAFLDAPDPECQGAVEERVEEHGDGGVGLGGLETELVVPVEGGCADGEGAVAESEARVG